MPRFALVPIGLGLVLVDYWLGRLDLAPDAIGWGVIALGLGGGQRLHPRLAAARLLAWGLAVVSLLSLVPGLEVIGPLTDTVGVLAWGLLVIGGIRALTVTSDPVTARRARVAAVVLTVGLVASFAATAATGFSSEPVAVEGAGGFLIVVGALLGLLVVVLLIVWLSVLRDHPALEPAPPQAM